jgi:hypothetical protein
MFAYGWLDEREDKYANIEVRPVQVTCIDWTLRQQGMPVKYAIQPAKKKRPGGHLGHMDHKAKQRYTTWIQNVPSVTTLPEILEVRD